jgi:putative membrane protein
MQIFLFFALIISVLAVVFAIQNNDPTTVSFLGFKPYNGSLALVLLVAVAAGSMISFFASLPSNLKTRWALRQQRKKLAELENNLATVRGQLEEAEKTITQLNNAASPPAALSEVAKPADSKPAPVKDPTVEA